MLCPATACCTAVLAHPLPPSLPDWPLCFPCRVAAAHSGELWARAVCGGAGGGLGWVEGLCHGSISLLPGQPLGGGGSRASPDLAAPLHTAALHTFVCIPLGAPASVDDCILAVRLPVPQTRPSSSGRTTCACSAWCRRQANCRPHATLACFEPSSQPGDGFAGNRCHCHLAPMLALLRPLRPLQMLRHLGDFPRRLREHAHAVYEYTPCPPVGYPEIEVRRGGRSRRRGRGRGAGVMHCPPPG